MKNIFSLFTWLSLASTAFALPVTTLEWGMEPTVISNVEFSTGTVISEPGMVTYAYSTTDPKSSQEPSVYTGIPIYGAFSLINGSGEGSPEFANGRYGLNTSSGGSIRLGAGAMTGSGGVTMRGLLFFEREDIAPHVSGPITLGAGSSISIARVGSSTQGATRSYRAAVYASVDGEWDWYVSLRGTSGDLTIAAADAEKWQRYVISDTTAPLDTVTSSTAAYTYDSSDFDDISRVGLWFNFTADEGKDTFLFIDSVSYTVTAIPEPGSVAALLGGIVLLVGVLRRRR